MKRLFILTIIITLTTINAFAEKVIWYNGHDNVTFATQAKYSPVVEIALDMFCDDIRMVTGKRATHKAGSRIEIYQLDMLNNKEFKKIQKRRLPYERIITHKETFYIGVHSGKIIIMGSDARGTAYGILEMSRMAGVSPWIWWGDVRPQMVRSLALDANFQSIQTPSVEYRGISITDEEWSLRPWAKQHFDKNINPIGPQAYRHIFELMLRLRANTLWPASKEGTTPFSRVKDNKELAEAYDIIIGSGNGEQMWCDDNYGYLTSRNVEQGAAKGNSDVLYHLSYSGSPHDYLWLSTTSPGLICHEMQQAYAQGAHRMWIANIHDPKVAAYQLSLFFDMAWNIKSAVDGNVTQHLMRWLTQQFGSEIATRLLPVMKEYYHLTSVRRPEFMGWSQVGLSGEQYEDGMSPVQNTKFDALSFGNELERYIEDFARLKFVVDDIEKSVKPELKDAFFAAIKYPVFAAAAMASKHLNAQEARHLARSQSFHIDDEALVSAASSVVAYREIQELTDYYNNTLAHGKWKGLMNMSPRNLPVFGEPTLPDKLSEQEIADYAHAEEIDCTLDMEGCIARNACDYTSATEGILPIELLGHSMKAVALPKDAELVYNFDVKKRMDALLYIAAIPTHSLDGGNVSFSVQLDKLTPMTFNIDETGNTDRWKDNVLRQQAVNTMKIYLSWGTHTLRIKALTDNVIIDQWLIDHELDRKFYMFPLQGAF